MVSAGRCESVCLCSSVLAQEDRFAISDRLACSCTGLCSTLLTCRPHSPSKAEKWLGVRFVASSEMSELDSLICLFGAGRQAVIYELQRQTLESLFNCHSRGLK